MTIVERAVLYMTLGYSAARIAEITGISLSTAIDLKTNGAIRR